MLINKKGVEQMPKAYTFIKKYVSSQAAVTQTIKYLYNHFHGSLSTKVWILNKVYKNKIIA